MLNWTDEQRGQTNAGEIDFPVQKSKPYMTEPDTDDGDERTDDQNDGLTIPDEPDDDDFDTVLDGRAADVDADDQGGDGDD